MGCGYGLVGCGSRYWDFKRSLTSRQHRHLRVTRLFACLLARTRLLGGGRGDGPFGGLDQNRSIDWVRPSHGASVVRSPCSSRCRRSACGLRVVSCVIDGALAFLFFPPCAIQRGFLVGVIELKLNLDATWLRACSPGFRGLASGAARLCTHRREGRSICHCECHDLLGYVNLC